MCPVTLARWAGPVVHLEFLCEGERASVRLERVLKVRPDMVRVHTKYILIDSSVQVRTRLQPDLIQMFAQAHNSFTFCQK